MSKYDDILKRNEQLIDNVYDMNEEITELANENELLTLENDELSVYSEALAEQNDEMKKSIAELHRTSSRRGKTRVRNTYVEQPQQVVVEKVVQRVVEQPQQVVQQPQQVTPQKVFLAFSIPAKTKKNLLFGTLIFLILLLGLGIEPGVALNYESILDCFLDLVFNLYKVCILGGIGFIIRKLWNNVK